MRDMAGLIMLIAALVIAGMAQAAQAGDWPMRGHDVAHSGVTDEVVEPQLELLWKYRTGNGVESSPAVSGGVVYVGSNDTYVYALDADTGSLKWKYQTYGVVGSSPTVSGGVVYIGADYRYLYALDGSNGSLKWKYQTGSGVRSSPVVSGGVIYVGSIDEYMYALDADTGSLKWKYQTGNEITSSPTVSGDIVYVGSWDNGNVYALYAGSGSLKWKYQTDYQRNITISIPIGVSSEEIGPLIYRFSDIVSSSPAVSGGTVYVGSIDNYVYALDASTGSLKWKYQTGDNVDSSPAVSGSVVYLGSDDNYVYALDASTGSLRWKYQTGDRVESSPAVSGDVMYVGSNDEYVYALDAVTGRVKWKYQTGGKVWSSPAVSEGVVYVGSGDNYVYAFASPSYFAKSAIIEAKRNISQEKAKGFNTFRAELTLLQAEQAFKNGNYLQIKNLTNQTKTLATDVDQDGIQNDKDFAPSINNDYIYSTVVIFSAVLLVGSVMTIRANLKRKEKHQQYLQTVPGLFDTAKALSSQANQLFQQKNYPSALQTYENALSYFTRASEGAKALNDTDLANSISNNISALQKNITACKNAIGTEIAAKARSKFEKGDFTGAIQTYEESLKYFQESELITKTHANIENCYIEIDARKVEELSAQAVSLLKEAATLNEPFKAIEKLNQANNRFNDAVALATKRKFADALSQLNTISKNIQDQRNIVHERLSSEPVISEKWDVEQLASKKSPAIQVAEHSSRLKALRESEFFNGFIRLRLSVSNKMSHTVTDVFLDIDLDENILRLDHYEPDTYAIRKGKLHLGNITPNNDKTIAVYLDPLTCSKEGTDVNCRIDYKDAYGRSDSIRMEPLKIPFTCPIFDTEQNINIGRLKELVASLPAHGSKVFSLSKGVEIGEAIALCREVIQMHDVRHVRTLKTTDGKTAETWYYGKTKVEKIDLVIKASVNKETGIDILVAAPDQKVLTGLLAELGRTLTEKGKSLRKFAPELNLTVRGSAVSKKRLLDLCDKYGNCGANVVMEDSVLY